MIVTKAWGTTEALIVNPLCELHRIVVRPGGFCSVHRHHGRANIFYCLGGSIEIRVLPNNDNDDAEITELSPGGIITVPPGPRHQFYSPHGAVVLELYYPVLRGEDIERYSQGGIQPR